MHTNAHTALDAGNSERCWKVRVAKDSKSLQAITGHKTNDFGPVEATNNTVSIDTSNIDAVSTDQLFVYNTAAQQISTFTTQQDLIIKKLNESDPIYDGDIIFISVYGRPTLAEYLYDSTNPKIRITPELTSSFHEGVAVIGVVVGQADHLYDSISKESSKLDEPVPSDD